MFLTLTGLYRLLVYTFVWEKGRENKRQTDQTKSIQSEKEIVIWGKEAVLGMLEFQCYDF